MKFPKFPKFNLFKKKENKEQEKNVILTGDSMRVRIYRLINNTAVEIGILNANITRDKNNNGIIIDEEEQFKEELPGMLDTLISDILYKYENRGDSKEEQLKKLNSKIKKQELIVKNEKKGYVKIKEKDIKINIETEKSTLRLLKCTKYTLENKKGEGYFESIELDGSRSLSYVVRDGELTPYWFKTPTSEGEPVTLVPDIAQRKKFYKEATDEAIADFNETQDTMWKGVLGLITKGMYILLALALIGGNVYNMRTNAELNDDSLQSKIDNLKIEAERIRLSCGGDIASQISNNGVLIDYAKTKIKEDMSKPKTINNDKNNIEI